MLASDGRAGHFERVTLQNFLASYLKPAVLDLAFEASV